MEQPHLIPGHGMILAAAIRCIEAGGESSIRIREIAAECGIATPIIYRAFGSRDGLIIAAQTERYLSSWREFGAPFFDAIKRCETRDQLKQLVVAMINAACQPDREPFRQVRMSVLGSSFSRPELKSAITAALSQVVASTADALEVAQSKGLLCQDLDLLAAAWWYLGEIDGRLLIEFTSADLDRSHWNEVATTATLAVLFSDE